MSEKEIEASTEVERYVTAILEAIFETAPKGYVDNDLKRMLDMDVILSALLVVQAGAMAHTNSLSGTPKALKKSVKVCAERLLRWTKEIREDGAANPFGGPSGKSSMPPHATQQ